MATRFEMHDNGLNVPATLRYTIYDKQDDLCVAAHSDETKAMQDCQTFNRLYANAPTTNSVWF